MYFLKRFLLIVLLQVVIFSFIFTLFIFNFNQRREVNKTQSKALATVIAEQATKYFEISKNNFSSKEFFSYLDKQIGVDKLTNAFNLNPPELLTIYFRSDIEKGYVNAGTDDNLKKDDNSSLNKSTKYFFNNKYVAIMCKRFCGAYHKCKLSYYSLLKDIRIKDIPYSCQLKRV